jgi:iron-sulfur cluster repair protein YtfE (RIC family)
MNPIEHLLQEHRDIMAQIADLRGAVENLTVGGDDGLRETLPVFRRAGHMLETQLARHARKEDEALFPALEAMFGAQGGPTAVMRLEHQAIHEQGELLRRTLRELTAVEHPQIEAGGEKLRVLAANGGDAETLRATAADIIGLLDAHFGKEEQILFPMAVQWLDDETLADVGRQIEQLGLG